MGVMCGIACCRVIISVIQEKAIRVMHGLNRICQHLDQNLLDITINTQMTAG